MHNIGYTLSSHLSFTGHKNHAWGYTSQLGVINHIYTRAYSVNTPFDQFTTLWTLVPDNEVDDTKIMIAYSTLYQVKFMLFLAISGVVLWFSRWPESK